MVIAVIMVVVLLAIFVAMLAILAGKKTVFEPLVVLYILLLIALAVLLQKPTESRQRPLRTPIHQQQTHDRGDDERIAVRRFSFLAVSDIFLLLAV